MFTKTGERLPLGLTLIRYDDQQVVGYLQDLRVQKAQQQQLRMEGQLLEERVRERTAELELEQASMQTFMQFTEAASQISDLDELALLALETLRSLLPGSNVVLTEQTPTHWHLRQWTDNLDPDLLAMARQHGFPLDTPVFAELLRTGEPSFTDAWDEHEQEVAHTAQFQAVAHYPIHQGGQVVAAIGVAVTNQRFWTEAQQAIVRSVGRSFTFLYDRLSVAQQLQEQNSELRARTQVLEGIEQLTSVRDELSTDPFSLIRRVQALVLSLLPPGYAAYFEPRDGRWRVMAQVGDCGSALLQAAIEAGFPVGQTPTLDIGAQTRAPHFVEVYDHTTDGVAEATQGLNSAANLPVIVNGELKGIFNVPLFQTTRWTQTQKTMLMTAVRSLELALERHMALEQLAQANMELQTANEELEAFTYSASHDLRTPVRHVMGFAELAERALEKTPNERVQQHLKVVKQAALRITDLIDGMLLLSRSGRQNVHAQPVDLNLLVTQARRDAVAEFGGHPVHWQIGELPIVQGDHSLLQQVMTNLLSNAVKYSAKCEVSEVDVWCEGSTSEWTIFVQDNGIGFEPQYAQKLFGIFQRLHTEKDFKGVGVGLATVRRIVQRHGGRVFAESDGQTGATFGFTLPKEGQRPQSLL